MLSKLAVKAKKRTVTFALSAPASVELRLSRCDKHRHCHRIRRFTVAGTRGQNSARLRGKLARGRYSVTATPAGGVARTRRFTIAR